MTIINSSNKVTYQGNGVTTQWPFDFPVLDKNHIKAIIRNPEEAETELTSDYYVDLIAGYVLYPGYEPGTEPPESQQPEKLPLGWTITIIREVPHKQETTLGDKWPFNVIESIFDKQAMQIQQLAEKLERSLKVSAALPSDIKATIPAPKPNMSWKWNEDGTEIIYTADPAAVLPPAQEYLQQAELAKTAAEAAKNIALDAEVNAEQALLATIAAKEIAISTTEEAKAIVSNKLDKKPDGSIEVNYIVTKGPWVDVKAFGAKGDGINNDTSSIKAALEYCKLNAKNLLFTRGSYIFNETLSIISDLIIKGLGRRVSVLRFQGVGIPAFSITTGATFTTLEDFSLYGLYDYSIDASVTGNYGIKADDPNHLTLKRLDIRKFGDSAVYIDKGIGVDILGCYIKNNLKEGVYVPNKTHGLTIKGGAIEFNKGWNIRLGNECMDAEVKRINCNIGIYDTDGGAIKTESSSPALDAIEISQIHCEGTAYAGFTHNYYMMEIESNNVSLHHNYFRAEPLQVLGAIKMRDVNNEIANNSFRSLTTAIKLVNVSASYITQIYRNTYDGVGTKIDAAADVARFNELGDYPFLLTQDIPLDFKETITIRIPVPRNRKTLLTSSAILLTPGGSTTYNAGVLQLSLNADMSNPFFTSELNFFKDRVIGTTIATNAPKNLMGTTGIYAQVTAITSCNARFALRFEWY